MASRRPRLLSPIALARRNAVYKGILGGERKWLAIGGVVWGTRFLKKAVGRNEQVVALEKLESGQAVLLTTIPPLKRREKKAVKVNAKQAERAARVAEQAKKSAKKSAKRAR
jgi:hypothetical protein